MIEKTLPQIILERIELGRSRWGAKRSRHLLTNDASDGIAAVAGELRDLAQRTAFFVEESNVHELIRAEHGCHAAGKTAAEVKPVGGEIGLGSSCCALRYASCSAT